MGEESPTAPRGAPRRDVLDRLLVRFPGLARLLAAGAGRIRRDSRFGRRLVERQVQRTFAAMARSDVEVVLLSYEPDTEVWMRDMSGVGLSDCYHGHEGIRNLYADLDEAFGNWWWTMRTVAYSGAHLAVGGDFVGYGRSSGVKTELTAGGTAVRFSPRGLVAWQEWFVEDGWKNALAAVGLSEQDSHQVTAPATARGVRRVVRPLGKRARRHRSLDERVSVRFPALVRMFTSAVMRLPPGSRLRRLLVARRIARLYAAANRRDFDVVLAGIDPRIYEYRPSRDLLPPDLEPVFHGPEGYRRLWRYWLDAFEDIRWDPEEVLDLGDKLLVTTVQKGHGSGSGVGVSKPVFQLFTLRGGLVIRQEDFLNRAEALEAAGRAD